MDIAAGEIGKGDSAFLRTIEVKLCFILVIKDFRTIISFRTLLPAPATRPTLTVEPKKDVWCWSSNALRANVPMFPAWATTPSELPTALANLKMKWPPPLSLTTSSAAELPPTPPRPTSSLPSATRFSSGILLQDLLSTTWPSITTFTYFSF